MGAGAQDCRHQVQQTWSQTFQSVPVCAGYRIVLISGGSSPVESPLSYSGTIPGASVLTQLKGSLLSCPPELGPPHRHSTGWLIPTSSPATTKAQLQSYCPTSSPLQSMAHEVTVSGALNELCLSLPLKVSILSSSYCKRCCRVHGIYCLLSKNLRNPWVFSQYRLASQTCLPIFIFLDVV